MLSTCTVLYQPGASRLMAGNPRQATGRAVPNWVTVAPDGKMVYISNAGLRSVSAVDMRAMKLEAVVPVGEVPKHIAAA